MTHLPQLNSRLNRPVGLLGRSYPHEYAFEYRISSPSSPATDYVPHRNETGATTTLATTALPATCPFIRTLGTGNALSILASLTGSAEMKALILLDGKGVKCTHGRGVTAQAVSAHVMGK